MISSKRREKRIGLRKFSPRKKREEELDLENFCPKKKGRKGVGLRIILSK